MRRENTGYDRGYLKKQAFEIQDQIRKLSRDLEKLQRWLKEAGVSWEGEAGELYRIREKEIEQEMEEILAYYQMVSRKLLEKAGIQEEQEHQPQEGKKVLPDNLIV